MARFLQEPTTSLRGITPHHTVKFILESKSVLKTIPESMAGKYLAHRENTSIPCPRNSKAFTVEIQEIKPLKSEECQSP
jgi:hypothetical protein